MNTYITYITWPEANGTIQEDNETDPLCNDLGSALNMLYNNTFSDLKTFFMLGDLETI